MRKKVVLMIVSAIIALVVVGVFWLGSVNIGGRLKRVDVYKISEMQDGKGNKGLISSFTAKEDLKVMREVFGTMEEISGILSMTSPDYRLKVIKKDSEEIWELWLQKDSVTATLVCSDDSHTGYTVTEETTSKLKGIIMR